jgi:Zn-dependent peptidase ImmA (M78 family)
VNAEVAVISLEEDIPLGVDFGGPINPYKALYKDLANTLNELKCSVNDHDYLGYCSQTKGIRAFIFINPSLNYQQRYFTLVHEAGHLFYMTKGKTFNWSKEPRSEDEANWFAVQVLRLNEMKSAEYWEFYNKCKKRKRKKSWFES